MYRKLQKELIAWKNSPNRMPLLIRGARQVGKTFLVEQLGKEHFKSILTVNFELEPKNAKAFESLLPDEIIARLSLLNRMPIVPGETLLFLDEIQQCPRAILALRYFKEKMPDLHVIGAGSLLEFTLHDAEFSFPVGRVMPIYLKPMSFQEFLENLGETQSIKIIETASIKNPPDTFSHEHLMGLVRQYFLVGGMPAVVQSFIRQKSWLECKRLQSALLQNYRVDFGKYATRAQHTYLEKVFEKTPNLVGQGIKYVNIDSEVRSRELKTAIQQLSWAGILTKVEATSASGIPLHAQVKEKQFKLIFLDIGLLQNANQIDSNVIFEQQLLQINQGALAEQFVGQELLAYADCYENTSLHFWQRDEKNSKAEVDYVINIGSEIVPIEVKAGKTGRLKSIRQFMKEKKTRLGIKISSEPLSLDQDLLTVPFYLVCKLESILPK